MNFMSKLYTFPDGTQGYNSPIDGQIFYTFDSKGSPTGMWQWDGKLQSWHDIYHNKPNATGRYVRAGDKIQIDIKNNKCECGSEISGSNKHSSWCPKNSV